MTELERCEIAKAKGHTYNPLTGEIRGVKGGVITLKSSYGYIYIVLSIKGKKYNLRGHRLAWYLHYGELPKNFIDHIDGDRANNKIENLRDVTVQENNFNFSLAKGYYWQKKDKKFIAQIQVNKQWIYLGRHNTEEEARNAYLEGKKKYHIIGQWLEEHQEYNGRETNK